MPEGDRLLAVVPHGPGDDAILQARDGKALRLALDGIRPVKTASAGGVAGMRLERGDEVVGATRAVDDDVLLVLHRRGAGKAVPVREYPAKGRGTGGVVSAATDTPEAHARRARCTPRWRCRPTPTVLVVTSGGALLHAHGPAGWSRRPARRCRVRWPGPTLVTRWWQPSGYHDRPCRPAPASATSTSPPATRPATAGCSRRRSTWPASTSAARPCLVVGAGPVGLEKIEGLLAAGARDHGDRARGRARGPGPRPRGLASRGTVASTRRADLEGRILVVAATSDTALNVRVFEDAERRAMLVNVVDVPPLCNFILPAIVRTGPIAIAISTSGASPALAKRLKREIAEAFGAPHARLAEILNELRGWAKDTFPTYEERRDFFEGIVNGEPDPIALLRAGDEPAVHALIAERRRAAERSLAVS